jgi:A/G-specific adenine glycosylase
MLLLSSSAERRKSDKLRRVWTRGLAPWYEVHGRHDLPWRATADPWAILVSEVMLQQTQVARVAGRWESFLERWPTPGACAAAPLPEVLREWQGLGYPRRARGLHDTATVVAKSGWPDTEEGLLGLPGVGRYTARALRVLAFGDSAVPPQDVNIARVTARAALGKEPGDVRQAQLEEQLAAGKPKGMTARTFTYALFDVGALHCRARPLCHRCPLATTCRSRDRLAKASPSPGRRQPAFRGSTRELRGAVLRAMLADPPPASIAELQSRAGAPAAGRASSDIAYVLDTLVHEGLVRPTPRMVRIN